MALTVKVRGDASQFEKVMKGVRGTVGSVGSSLMSLTKIGLGVSAALAGGVLAGGAFALKLGMIAEDGKQAEDRLANVIKSMGLFGDESSQVAKRLGDLADATGLQTGVDDDVILATQAKLATFKELAKTMDVVGGTFDRATNAAIDMGAAGFGEATQNAVQLGKALNDPIKGITALARSGITFTDQEKDKIKTLMESGRALKAQDLILKAIETQVGGTAAATAKGSDQMKVAFSQLAEILGGPVAAGMKGFADGFISQMPKMKASFSNLVNGLQAAAPALGSKLGSDLGFIIAEALAGNEQPMIRAAQLGFEVYKAAWKTSYDQQWMNAGIGIANAFGADLKNESWDQTYGRHDKGVRTARDAYNEATQGGSQYGQVEETRRIEELVRNREATERLIQMAEEQHKTTKEMLHELRNPPPLMSR